MTTRYLTINAYKRTVRIETSLLPLSERTCDPQVARLALVEPLDKEGLRWLLKASQERLARSQSAEHPLFSTFVGATPTPLLLDLRVLVAAAPLGLAVFQPASRPVHANVPDMLVAV